jgi:hypothetical protein
MDSGPEINTHHHHHTGRQWVDVILGVSVVVISIISLMLAAENGQAMKRLVAANSWPFVLTSVSNSDENGDKFLNLVMQNKGVGPAKIESLEVFYAGKSVPDARTLLHTILGPSADGQKIPYKSSTVVGNVLSAKEIDAFLTVSDKSIPPDELRKLSESTANIDTITCYCSVFDECWRLDTRNMPIHADPVKACPVPTTPFSQ